MENIGALSILLAFCLAVYAVIGSVIGKIKKNPFLVISGERAIYSRLDPCSPPPPGC